MRPRGKRGGAAAHQRVLAADARRLKRRQRAEDDPAHRRGAEREQQRRAVEAHIGDARRAVRRHRNEHAQEPAGHRDAQRPAADRDQRAFDEQLVRDPEPPAAERRADGELVLPARAARNQQVRDVHAGDQQQTANCAEQREQRRTDAAHELIGEPRCSDANRAVRVRVLVFERLGDSLQFIGRRLHADVGLQPTCGREAVVVAAIYEVRRRRQRPDRDEEIDRAGEVEPRELEAARHDANNRVQGAVEPERPSEHVRIGIQPRAPERVGDDGDRRRVRLVVVVDEGAAQRRRHAQHRENIGRGPARPQPLGAIVAGERHRLVARQRQRLERSRASAPIEVVRPRNGNEVAFPIRLVGVHEAIGIGQRQRLE